MPTYDFTGTNGTALTAYSADFFVPTGGVGLQLNNGTATAPGSGGPNCVNGYNGSAADAHYAQCVIATGQDNICGPAVRVQSGANSFFYARYVGFSSTVYAGECIAGTGTDWDSGVAGWAEGDTIRLEIDSGTSTTIYLKKNGTTVATYTSKNALSGGKPGISAYVDTNATGVTSLEVGNVTATGYTIIAAQGTYSLTGQAANFLATRLMPAAQGSYTLTGQNTTLSYTVSRTLLAETTTYILIGSDALIDRSINAESGSYSLTGQTSNLVYTQLSNFSIIADFGSYSLTGQAVNTLFNYKIFADLGTYSLTGRQAGLVWSGAPISQGNITYRINISTLHMGL